MCEKLIVAWQNFCTLDRASTRTFSFFFFLQINKSVYSCDHPVSFCNYSRGGQGNTVIWIPNDRSMIHNGVSMAIFPARLGSLSISISPKNRYYDLLIIIQVKKNAAEQIGFHSLLFWVTDFNYSSFIIQIYKDYIRPQQL